MANWINDIEIKNFKSIRQARIEDCRRINVFIGYPNVGKSNILEALGLLAFISSKRPRNFEGLVRLEKMVQLFHFFNIQESAEIHFNDHFSLEVNYNDEEKIDVCLIDTRVSRTEMRNLLSISSPLRIGFETMGSGQTDGIDNFSGRIPELKNFFVKPYKFEPRKGFGSAYSALELKVPAGENLFEVIASSSVIKAQFADLLKTYNLRMVVNIADNSITILLPQSNQEVIYTIPVSLLADTLTRLIFFKAAIHSNKNSVLLFEEPEAHMFPPYISKFTTDIMYDDNDNQYFIATHSPFVINDFMENLKYEELSIYVVGYKKETGETEIRRLTEEELHEIYQYGIDLFLNVGNFLESE